MTLLGDGLVERILRTLQWKGCAAAQSSRRAWPDFEAYGYGGERKLIYPVRSRMPRGLPRRNVKSIMRTWGSIPRVSF